ncbi:MAG TPA: N-acetylmuramoyl-L-alanine amidase-like domain-containing protein [Longimicrobiales bacterium]
MKGDHRAKLTAGALVLVAAVIAIVVLGCRETEQDGPPADAARAAEQAGRAAPESGALPGGPAAPPPADVPAAGPTERDLQIFNETMVWARAERLDTLPIGEIMVRIGRRFVGAPYRPGLLEVPGPERLVINLREYDCVTYVETMLALARMVRAGEGDFDAFQREVVRIRYRGGVINGYPSRLHYFSEWISDNEAKGIVQDVTRELGGVPTDEPIDFMSRNAGSYPKLGDPANLEAIRATEQRLSTHTRYVIPEDRIAEAAPRVQNGDIIAATSSTRGLDIAHTGLAIWIGGRLHLMHAPLVGKTVEISELPLAERIQRIEGQDGIMVARPQ